MTENKNQNDASKKEKMECLTDQRGKFICNPPVRNITHPLRYYEFTRDEIKVLEECDKESFYRRCIPYSTLFATATYAAIKFGILKRNADLGIFPKVLIAFVIGHFYGRYAYIPLCEAKLRRKLPADSYLGNIMRYYHCERTKNQP